MKMIAEYDGQIPGGHWQTSWQSVATSFIAAVTIVGVIAALIIVAHNKLVQCNTRDGKPCLLNNYDRLTNSSETNVASIMPQLLA